MFHMTDQEVGVSCLTSIPAYMIDCKIDIKCTCNEPDINQELFYSVVYATISGVAVHRKG